MHRTRETYKHAWKPGQERSSRFLNMKCLFDIVSIDTSFCLEPYHMQTSLQPKLPRVLLTL